MYARARRDDPNGFRLWITNDEQHAQVLDRVDELAEAASGTPAGDEQEWLINQAQKYEREA